MKHATRSDDVFRSVMMCGAAAILAAATLVPAAAQVQHTVVPGDAVKWGPAPPSLPPGAEAAVLVGNPANKGPFVLRLKFPAGFTVPPHRHQQDEAVTVISGRFVIASGEKVDKSSVKTLPAGSVFYLPTGMPHYGYADVESVVQINGMGPFEITYVDSKDDPRKK